MQNLIDRLKIVRQNITDDELNRIAVDEELAAIIQGLETLDQEHTRQTDELRGHRETLNEIYHDVQTTRRKYNIWQDEISNPADDVSFLLTDMGTRLSTATDDAAALRAALESIRDTVQKRHYEDGQDVDLETLLDVTCQKATAGLKEHKSGAALRKELRQLEAAIDAFERGMQETGGWRYGGHHTLADRVNRCADHYTRMAARAVSDSHTFKDSTVSWLRGVAINAQAVSWATTHHEKDARLRGLIEVIETAIAKIDELRVTDRLSSWNGVVDSWMKSDFPTREMRRRILDQQKEIERLKQKAGEATESTAASPNNLF